MLCYNVSFASLVTQAKYESVHGTSSVHIVTPDWIVRCVEAMSHIHEIRYHPRLLLSVSQEFVHQCASVTPAVQSLSPNNCQLDNSVPLSSDSVLDTSQYAKPSISIAPVSVISATVASHHHVQTYPKRMGNEVHVFPSPLKSFGSTKVCMYLCFKYYCGNLLLHCVSKNYTNVGCFDIH